jgi:adenylate kinase
MRVALTGTPGTGKTTVAEQLEIHLGIVHLNQRIEAEGLMTGVDAERGSWIADLEAVRDRFGELEDVVIESHLAHRLDVDRVIVLRCAPDQLEQRLRDRGEPAAKAAENADAEALDLVLSEAVAEHGEANVAELDTTAASPATVARAVEAVLRGDRDPGVGRVSFIDYLAP